MTKPFNPLDYSNCFSFPLWLTESAWIEHIPFAMFVVLAAQPEILVELGTWRGVSYCAFCQAIKESQMDTRCYAIDTWRGDEHAGNLAEEALFSLRQHHDPRYASFSRLVQSTFDQALTHFSDSSIDLLHIDGFHTYEAVKHDFETWLPKMSARGIILFHDLNVRERDFGVYRLWEELQLSYPAFAFAHGHGLGVLATGANIPEDLRFLFEAKELEAKLLREFFHALGSRIDATWRLQEQEKTIFAQEKHISVLQTYEEIVVKSNLMRAYRVLKDEGVGSLIKKAIKQK